MMSGDSKGRPPHQMNRTRVGAVLCPENTSRGCLVKRNVLDVYAFAACFASLLFLVVSVATCLNEFLRIVAPSVTVSGYEHWRSMSDEQFLQMWPHDRPAPEPSTVARLRTEAWESALSSEQHNGLQSFLQSLMYIVAAGFVFWRHWRLAQRERAAAASA